MQNLSVPRNHTQYGSHNSVNALFHYLGHKSQLKHSLLSELLTGYKTWKGQVLNSSDLAEVYAGLQENCLNCYSHLLTGKFMWLVDL